MELPAAELKGKLERGEDFFLLDVRTPQEFQGWKIEGAVNIPLQELSSRTGEIPNGKEIIAICAHGIRSAFAAKQLGGQGFRVRSVTGGMAGWNGVYECIPLLEGEVQLYQVKRVGKGCSGYFLVSGGKAAVIDPTTHTQEYLRLAERFGCTIQAILDTHQHADHISGARLLQKATKAEFFLNPLDGYQFPGFREMGDGQSIRVGEASLTVMHTPGHTRGSTSLLVEGKVLLTGDILFTEGIARPDLKDRAEEYAAQLYETYQNRILPLPGKVVVGPAHYQRSPFGEAVARPLEWIRKNNRVFELSKGEFIQYVTSHIPAKPFHYEEIIRANTGLMGMTEEEIAELEFGANRCVLAAP